MIVVIEPYFHPLKNLTRMKTPLFYLTFFYFHRIYRADYEVVNITKTKSNKPITLVRTRIIGFFEYIAGNPQTT